MNKLILYIAGNTTKSKKISERLKGLLDDKCTDNYNLEILDLLKYPEKAIEDGVFITPILIKKIPPPVRKIYGDLMGSENILTSLELEGI